MRFGLHLRGGGAKGAFQAGLLCAFWQRGVTYSVVSGTSIGAVNGWFVMHNAFKEMEELYMNLADDYKGLRFSGKVIDNSLLIEKLRHLPGAQTRQIDAFYVNYCPVRDGQIHEITEDIKGADIEYALERIRWSSLLPYNYPEMNLEEFKKFAQEHDLSEGFKEDLAGHVYDGFNLDGGMINNRLIRKVFDHTGERIIVMGYQGTREEYLDSLDNLPVSERERITYIASDHPFDVSDTYNFEPDFLKVRFQEGYARGLEYPLIRLTCS